LNLPLFFLTIINYTYYTKVYNPEISKHHDIAFKKEKEDSKIYVGYFGHMTES